MSQECSNLGKHEWAESNVFYEFYIDSRIFSARDVDYTAN